MMMATAPLFMSDHFVFSASCSVANTNRDGSGTLATPTWKGTTTTAAPTTPWMLKRINILHTSDLNDCTITLFYWDGSTARYFYEYDLNNPPAASATASGLLFEVPLPASDYTFPGGVDLRFGITAAPASGICVVHGFVEAA